MSTRIPLRTTDTQAKDLADKLEMSTAEIGLSVRTTNCLEERGIFTVNDLLHCTRDDLLSISNFGEKTLEEVYKALEGIGFYRRAGKRASAAAAVAASAASAADHVTSHVHRGGESPLWRAVFATTGRNDGNRRTGSPALAQRGRGGLLRRVLCCLGCGGTGAAVLPAWSCPSGASTTSSSKPRAKCSTSGSARSSGEDGPLYRPEIKIEYEVGGVTYRDWHYDIHRRVFQRAGERAGHPRPVRLYDRAKTIAIRAGTIRRDPDVVVLVRGYRWWIWLVFTVPVSFVAHRRRRPDLRAAALGEVGGTPRGDGRSGRQERDFFGANGGGRRQYPFVPPGRRHDQQPRHAAPVPPADGHVARLGAVRHAGVLRDLERHRVGVRGACRARPSWPASPTGS